MSYALSIWLKSLIIKKMKREYKMRFILGICLSLLVILPTMAQPLPLDDNKTVLNLSAEARKSVNQDRLIATLYIEYTAKTAAQVQAYINKKMKVATNLTDMQKNIKVTTGGYNVYKNYKYQPQKYPNIEPEKRIVQWQGRQTLYLDGIKSDAILDLVGKIQQIGFASQGLSYYLSREKSDSLKDELIAKALKTIKVRAQKIANQLTLPNLHFAHINLGAPGFPMPMPMMRTEMAMDSMNMNAAPSPTARSGETDVSVYVNAVIYLTK